MKNNLLGSNGKYTAIITGKTNVVLPSVQVGNEITVKNDSISDSEKIKVEGVGRGRRIIKKGETIVFSPKKGVWKGVKLLTLILSLFAHVAFCQTTKEKEVLKAMNVYKFPAPELVFSQEMNDSAKVYARILNKKTTQEEEDNYFACSKYVCYAVIAEADYSAKEILYYFEQNNGYLKQLVEGSKEVGIYATNSKCIIIFSSDVEVFLEEVNIEVEEE